MLLSKICTIKIVQISFYAYKTVYIQHIYIKNMEILYLIKENADI